MATFNPPTVVEGIETSDPLVRRYKLSRGITVIKTNGHYVNHRFPTIPDLAGLVEGTDYFIGGKTYTVTSAVATALNADGYTTT